MRFLSAKISGFRTFAREQTFEFPEVAGLFLIRGENRVAPNLEGNAVGKSTLWDAVCWCFYGKTARGLTAGEVEAWDAHDGCSVQVDLEIAGTRRRVFRGRSPIRFTIDGEPADQNALDDLVGPYEQFLNSVLMSQFGILFPDLKPAARLAVVTDALKLDVWVSAGTKASNEAKALEALCQKREQEVARLTTKIETMGRELESAVLDFEKWDLDREGSIRDLGFELVEAKERRHDTSAKLDDLHERVREAEASTEDSERRAAKLTSDVNAMKLESERARVRIETEEASLTKLLQKSKNVGDLADKKCPTCLQEVGKKHTDRIREEHESELTTARATLEKLKSVLKEHSYKVKRSWEEVDEAVAEVKARRKKHADLTADRNVLSKQLGSMNESCKALAARIESLRSSENPHEKRARRIEEELDTLNMLRDDAEVLSYDARGQLDLMSFWVTGFRDLRLWLVDQALDELTIHANSSLVELGLKGWSVEFAAERENKSGTITKGFEIIVRSPKSPMGVRWENWSGGETQRLRVACAVGLANLIRARMPDPPEVEVWDEPTAHLNAEGVRDLIEFFSERGSDRQVWLVDHRSLDAGVFDGVYTVVKEKTGSRIEGDSR